jgi:ABC-type lipoprotein release transport system permease subunit
MMLRLIWRNLWRNPRRTWITTSSIAFAVFLSVAMHAFQKGVFDHLIRQVVGAYTGHIQVHQAGYWDEQVIDNIFPFTTETARALDEHPDLAGYAMRLETFLLASTGTTTKGCMLIGTEPVREQTLMQLESKLTAGSYFGPDDTSVILAEGLASRLKLTPGDTIVLLGQGYHGAMAAGKFPVAGTVHLPSPEMNQQLAFMPLLATQVFLDAPGMLSTLALNLRRPEGMSDLQADLRQRLSPDLEILTWEELLPEITDHIQADRRSSYIFSGILYLIIAFGFFGTVMMMTAERRYEFGMLTAIGMSRKRLGLVLLGETLLLTLVGAALGILVSLPGVWYFTHHPIRLTGQTARAYAEFGFEPVLPATMSPENFIIQTLIVALMALVVGLYPLWHIRRLDTLGAMRTR